MGRGAEAPPDQGGVPQGGEEVKPFSVYEDQKPWACAGAWADPALLLALPPPLSSIHEGS